MARHETRQSAFNVATRRNRTATKRHEQSGERKAIALQYAQDLSLYCKSRLSLQSALHLLTSSPQLMRLPPPRLAERMAAHAGALGLALGDVADLLVRSHRLVDMLPFKLRQGAEALAAALDVPLVLALVVAAQFPAALSQPPLLIRQRTGAIAAALEIPFRAAAALVVREAGLFNVQPHMLPDRVAALGKLLGIPSPAALELCCDEPRLLLPAPGVIRNNHLRLVMLVKELLDGRDDVMDGGAANRDRDLEAASDGGGAGPTSGPVDGAGEGSQPAAEPGEQPPSGAPEVQRMLRSWARRAPMLLVRRADAVAARLRSLPAELAAAAPSSLPGAGAAVASLPPRAVARWVARDPRVLLVRPGAAERAVRHGLSPSVMRTLEVVYALVAAHPSYLVLREGAGLDSWAADVGHLLQLPKGAAGKLAAEPEVFLTLLPGEILTAVHALSDVLRAPFTAARAMALLEPRLLLHPAGAVASEFSELQRLLPSDARAGVALLRRAPALLLPGGRGAALRGRLEGLARELRVPLADVARAAAANPEVLAAPATGARAAARALAGGGAVGEGRAAAVLLAQPALMHLGEEALSMAAQAVISVLSRHPPWLEAFRHSLDPSAAGLLLRHHRARLPLLLFLSEKGLQARVPLGDAVLMGQDARYRQFGSEWTEWALRYKSLEMRRRLGSAEGGAELRGSGGGESDASDGGAALKSGDDGAADASTSASSGAGGGGGARGGGVFGSTSAEINGVVLGWPGAPNQRQRQILRLQRDALRMYPPGTAGLLDGFWSGRPWHPGDPGDDCYDVMTFGKEPGG